MEDLIAGDHSVFRQALRAALGLLLKDIAIEEAAELSNANGLLATFAGSIRAEGRSFGVVKVGDEEQRMLWTERDALPPGTVLVLRGSLGMTWLQS